VEIDRERGRETEIRRCMGRGRLGRLRHAVDVLAGFVSYGARHLDLVGIISCLPAEGWDCQHSYLELCGKT
jgi:hypothetical protein